MQKNYELRQYKKGLKLAEGILKKYPDHGGKIVLEKVYFDGNLTFFNFVRNYGHERFIFKQSRKEGRRLRVCKEGSLEKFNFSYL